MRRIVIILISILGLISIDFLSKQYIEGIFDTSSPMYFPIIGEFIGIKLSYNSGIAFSLPITGIPLQIITLGLVLGLIVYYIRIEYPKKSYLLDAGYVSILAGALSHTYERVFIGHVIDFILIKYFAILNFADIFISIGACIIFYIYYVKQR